MIILPTVLVVCQQASTDSRTNRPSSSGTQEPRTHAAKSTRIDPPGHKPARPIPPAPRNLYDVLQRSSPASVISVPAGEPAPRGLGGRASEKQKKKDLLLFGPDVTLPNVPQQILTPEQAFKFIARDPTSFINRSIIDTDEKFIEKVFFDSTASELKAHLESADSDAKPGGGPGRIRGFLRSPVPWIKKKMGIEEENRGFRELPFWIQPDPSVDRSLASPSMYSDGPCMDLPRKQRLERLFQEELKLKQEASIDGPLYDAVNVGAGSATGVALRQAAQIAAEAPEDPNSINEDPNSISAANSINGAEDPKTNSSKVGNSINAPGSHPWDSAFWVAVGVVGISVVSVFALRYNSMDIGSRSGLIT